MFSKQFNFIRNNFDYSLTGSLKIPRMRILELIGFFVSERWENWGLRSVSSMELITAQWPRMPPGRPVLSLLCHTSPRTPSSPLSLLLPHWLFFQFSDMLISSFLPHGSWIVSSFYVDNYLHLTPPRLHISFTEFLNAFLQAHPFFYKTDWLTDWKAERLSICWSICPKRQ